MENERKDDAETGRPEPPAEKDERTFVSLGADPSDLEHSRNRVAYLTGYKHGIWDAIHIALSFVILIAIINGVKRYVTE